MSEPRRERPGFGESYGIPAGEDGLLPWSFATERLRESRNYWICSTRADGRPSATPVWGAWVGGALVFGAAPSSTKARNIARDPRIQVHLESGDECVILEGEAAPPTEEELAGYVAECRRKYDWEPEPGFDAAYFALRPRLAWAWLERDYSRTATRFVF